MLKFAGILLLPMAFLGCANYMAVGGFETQKSVMLGNVHHDLVNGRAAITMAEIRRGGVECSGKSTVTKIPNIFSCRGQEGVAHLKCTDGRTLNAKWLAESCTSGHGSGLDNLGNSFGFVFGLDEEEAREQLANRLSDQGLHFDAAMDARISALADDLRRKNSDATNKEIANLSQALAEVLAIGAVLYLGYEAAKIGALPSAGSAAWLATPNPETTTRAPSGDICNCRGYAGPGGPCYSGPGGPAYDGPGGPAYAGAGGPCYRGPGGPEHDGPGGPAFSGPGGPRYDGAGGPAYDGPGGPAYSGPGGPCYAGTGGPCYSGPGGTGFGCPSICR